jgi:hypothetical protein
MSLQQVITGWKMTGHISGDTFDCRRVNLCELDESLRQTGKLPLPGAASRFKGVYPARGAWRARITYKRQRYHLGTFAAEEGAARAYDKQARELFGPYAMTNERLGLYADGH